MERLTKIENGVPVYVGPGCESPGGSIPAELSTSQIREALTRLVAYEDTGLMPEEVATMKLALMGKSVAEIEEFEEVSIERLKELAEAGRDGRVKILPEGKRGTCGSCKHFQPIPESHSGTCSVKPCRVDRQGRVYPSTPFYTYQSRKSCKRYSSREAAVEDLAAVLEAEEGVRLGT